MTGVQAVQTFRVIIMSTEDVISIFFYLNLMQIKLGYEIQYLKLMTWNNMHAFNLTE